MQELLILSNPVQDSPCCIADPSAGEPLQYLVYGIHDFPEEPIALIPSALTGGTFVSYLREEMEKNRGKICLHLTPLSTRFTLPSYSGTGEELDQSQLEALLECHTAVYSEHLFCNYIFSSNHHTVTLFDDASSLQRKYDAARACGIPYIILSPDVYKKLRLPEKQGV